MFEDALKMFEVLLRYNANFKKMINCHSVSSACAFC